MFLTGDKRISESTNDIFLLSCQDFEWSTSGLVIWAIILSVLIINSATFRAKIRTLQPTCSSSWQCVVVFLFSTLKSEQFFVKRTPANTSTWRKFYFLELDQLSSQCVKAPRPPSISPGLNPDSEAVHTWDWPKSTTADCCGSCNLFSWFCNLFLWFCNLVYTSNSDQTQV